jgi:hypothetical protein
VIIRYDPAFLGYQVRRRGFIFERTFSLVTRNSLNSDNFLELAATGL